MKLKNQKRIAAQVLKVSVKRVIFDKERLADIKEAITKADIRSLINEKAIKAKPIKGVSRGRARKVILQHRKGRRKGRGSKKGKSTAKAPRKRDWINRIRIQRNLLSLLKEKKVLTPETYRMLYRKAKGGFFRSKRHLKLYMKEHKLTVKKIKENGKK